MQNSNQALIDQISESGINFSVSTESPHGSTLIFLDKSLVLEYISDKYSALAKHFAVSKADYLAWLEQDMSVQCCGKTLKDKRCKRIVPNGIQVNVGKWVEMQGSLCDIHST